MIPHIYILFEFISITIWKSASDTQYKENWPGPNQSFESIQLRYCNLAKPAVNVHDTTRKTLLGRNLFVFFYGGGSGWEWGEGVTAAAGAGETGVRSEEYFQTCQENLTVFNRQNRDVSN